MAWLCAPKFYYVANWALPVATLLGIQLAYSFANTLPASRIRLVHLPIFYLLIDSNLPISQFFILQCFPMYNI